MLAFLHLFDLIQLSIIPYLNAEQLSTESESSSQWTPQLTAEWRQHSQAAIKFFAGKNYYSTAFENEKRSYPRTMIDFLAGNEKRAIAFLHINKLFQI
ncbi:MAG: hypothetical protein RMY34_18785 [Aulosira sp. DedQUE10]|nr:hypothetical protein [Aulosira sp. DedQUE10]